MVRIVLNIRKNVDENATHFFEVAKKAKKKLEGAKEALIHSLVKLEAEKIAVEKSDEKRIKERKIKREIHWYEKFRWFFTSTGFLVIGGRDATTNEIIVKKHSSPGDIIFHTDMAGSPFFLIKSDNKTIDEQTIKEVADATCSYSRAWKLGLMTQSVFYVNPDQVTKEANSGEYLTKGAFMIKGKTNYVENKINQAICVLEDGRVMGGPIDAVKSQSKIFLIIEQGDDKPSAVAKKIKAKLGGSIDDIIKALPPGNCKIISK